MSGVLANKMGDLVRTGLMVCALCLLVPAQYALAATVVSSARIWPAQEYTRLTLEANAPVPFKYFQVPNPNRLVIDMENVELGKALEDLAPKVAADDPYIEKVRVGRFKPNVIRMVLDLKTEIKVNVFTLDPVGEYKNRLVVDVYPAQPKDPLLALLNSPSPQQAAAGDTADSTPASKADSPPDKKDNKLAANKDDAASASNDSLKRNKKGYARLLTVAVDAGHGGEDPGAHGLNGTNEKDVTLAIARRLKAKIDAQEGMRAYLTRDGDYFVPLGTRVVKARNVKADLFVSIHADASPSRDARGSSVFALSEHGATSAAARWLAKKENDADLIGGVNIGVKDRYLAQTLLDLSQTATINDSLKLGKSVLGEIGSINRLHQGKVEQAGFAVLKAPDIPSILVETAFISNPDEEAKLKDDDYQDRLADAILAGIKRYFAQNPPVVRDKLAQN